jgi:hypothetical protein
VASDGEENWVSRPRRGMRRALVRRVGGCSVRTSTATEAETRASEGGAAREDWAPRDSGGGVPGEDAPDGHGRQGTRSYKAGLPPRPPPRPVASGQKGRTSPRLASLPANEQRAGNEAVCARRPHAEPQPFFPHSSGERLLRPEGGEEPGREARGCGETGKGAALRRPRGRVWCSDGR